MLSKGYLNVCNEGIRIHTDIHLFHVWKLIYSSRQTWPPFNLKLFPVEKRDRGVSLTDKT